MSKRKKIFFATPISGFGNKNDYENYRTKLIELLHNIEEYGVVYCEIKKVKQLENYDEPQNAIIDDFKKIRESDIFIMYHPFRMQTSTLIELGYAVANEKKILIIAKKDDLPYLANGLSAVSKYIRTINSSELNNSTMLTIKSFLEEISNS